MDKPDSRAFNVVTMIPTPVSHDELNSCRTRGSNNLAHMIEQMLFLRDRFDQRPDH